MRWGIQEYPWVSFLRLLKCSSFTLLIEYSWAIGGCGKQQAFNQNSLIWLTLLRKGTLHSSSHIFRELLVYRFKIMIQNHFWFTCVFYERRYCSEPWIMIRIMIRILTPNASLFPQFTMMHLRDVSLSRYKVHLFKNRLNSMIIVCGIHIKWVAFSTAGVPLLFWEPHQWRA